VEGRYSSTSTYLGTIHSSLVTLPATMIPRRGAAASLLFSGGSGAAAAAGGSLCSLVAENSPTSLVCPAGSVVTSIDQAVFGTFEPGSACPQPVPTNQCPTPVRAQVELLCVGRPNCTVHCHCDADEQPACLCHNDDSGLQTAVPAFPCDGVPKQLAVAVSCAPAVEDGFLPIPPAAAAAAPAPAVTGLQLEFLPSEPVLLGLDELRPHMSWVVAATATSSLPQTGFQIDVWLAPNGTSVWSSGRVESANPMHVPAEPLPLESDTVRACALVLRARPVRYGMMRCSALVGRHGLRKWFCLHSPASGWLTMRRGPGSRN
jgi:hypothetical protein